MKKKYIFLILLKMLNININMDHLNMVKEYYKELKEELNDKLFELCKTNELFNKFILVSIKNNIYLFKKKNNRWYFKTESELCKDYKIKKKTILRKHASQLIEISKSEMSENDQEINVLSNDLKLSLKELGIIIKLYRKLNDQNIFDLLKDESFNLDDLKKLSSFNDYSKKIRKNSKKKYKVNEVNYIAEYGN